MAPKTGKKKSEQPKLELYFGKRKRDQETVCLDGIVHTADSQTQAAEAGSVEPCKPGETVEPLQVSPPEPPSSVIPVCVRDVDQLPCTSTSASAALKATVVTVKHAKDFDSNWKHKRPWLQFVPGSGMFCSYCKMFNS